MTRPTIALACILKNEIKNIPRLLTSVKGCFDEIHMTDTGSTDGSIELLQCYTKENNPAETPIFLHHFTWVDDFSKARNASFEPVKTDFIMWLDLDDVLTNQKAFIDFRDNVMTLGDFWMATYHYALDKFGNPKCSFARERVVRRALNFNWRYFVHEGMMPESSVKKEIVMQYAVTWAVNHMRDEEDLKQDRSRNIRLFEKNKDSIDSRMRYYFGKELFENGKPLEAFNELMTAITNADLQPHDSIMGIQYACMAAMQLGQNERAIQLAHQGLQLEPKRAEFHVTIGDCYLKMGKLLEAVPFFLAAAGCHYNSSQKVQGAIFANADAYLHYPLNQLARIYANIGDMDKAEEFANRAANHGANAETLGILGDIKNIRTKVGLLSSNRKKVDDIAISCPPGGLYEWDGEIYRQKGIGGSETAAVEIAEHIAEITGRKVIVFNKASLETKSVNGIEYRPTAKLPEYLRDHSPSVHIGWRHATKLSEDPMWVWCHDLGSLGIDNPGNYHQVLALSAFHRQYLRNMFGVPDEKITVTRNGIDPSMFMKPKAGKKFGKIVYSSSPDRGLLNAIKVMDEVVKTFPEAQLHVFYGFDNMMKMGMKDQAEQIQSQMTLKDYIVYHGNITQAELTKEFETACVWLYPTNFLETFCITAIEALCSQVYPVVRSWGALPHTLAAAKSMGMATILDHDCVTQSEIEAYATAVRTALAMKSWESIKVDPQAFSWRSVAEEWLKIFGIEVASADASAVQR